jgi:AcrR family transcriptional regulator
MVRIVKKAEVRRAEIIHAARALLQAKEVDKMTMQDVMDDLGIAKGTIYHYFKSKEELLEAVVVNIVDEATAQMQAILDETKGNALEKMSRLIRAGNVSADNDKVLEQLHSPANREMHVRLLAVALIKQAPLYARLFQQGCDEGLFQTDNPLECAEFILAGIQFITDEGIYPWTPEDLRRRAQAVPALMEAQLKAAPGSFQSLFSQIS